MIDRIELTITVAAPETERELQLRFYILENYRENRLDLDILHERMLSSGFGEHEYNRMVTTMKEDDYLTQQNRHRLQNAPELRLSRLGKSYLERLREQGVPQVVQPVPLQLAQATPPAVPQPWWRTFWRRDVAIITGIVAASAAVAIATSRCGAM